MNIDHVCVSCYKSQFHSDLHVFLEAIEISSVQEFNKIFLKKQNSLIKRDLFREMWRRKSE